MRYDKIEKARLEVHKVLNKHNLEKLELIQLLALIGFDIGSAIHPDDVTKLSSEDLVRSQRDQPNIATAVMLQSIMVGEWAKEQEKRDAEDPGTGSEIRPEPPQPRRMLP